MTAAISCGFCLAVMLFVSAILLLYSAAVVPFQICMWDYSDPCNLFPTLRFDMFVDVFFMVRCRPCCSAAGICPLIYAAVAVKANPGI